MFTSVAEISTVEQNFGQTAMSNMAVIGDNVFLDTTGTGIQSGVDSGPQMAGVTVNLLEVNGSSVTEIATTTTNAQGLYQFIANPGTYEVQFVGRTAILFAENAGVQRPTLASSVNPVDRHHVADRADRGRDRQHGDAGLYQDGAINSNVWFDTNGNGVPDGGETGVGGITVELLSNGTVLATTTTSANGNYSFSDLPVGTYQTDVLAPGGDQISTVNAGIDSGITLTPGESDTVAPTGLYVPAAFDVHVYYDTNDNSTQDNGESNVGGVTVSLLNGNGTPTGETAVTDSNGNVSFTGLVPGSYEVAVTTPGGDTITQDTNVSLPDTLLSGQTAYAVEGVFLPVSPRRRCRSTRPSAA